MYLFPDGDTYIGEFKNGKSHGHGVYLTSCGHQYYEGSYARDAKDGWGFYSNEKSGTTYLGMF